MSKTPGFSWNQIKPAFNFTVLVASLGYFVDMYDLVLYGIVRIPSLKDLGITGDELVTQGICHCRSRRRLFSLETDRTSDVVCSWNPYHAFT